VTTELLLLDEDHLEFEVRVREKRRQRDQFLEQVTRRTPFRRATAIDPTIVVALHDPPPAGDGEHQPQPVFRQQRAELRAHRAEVARLHLEQQSVGDDVDHVAADLHLEAAARWGNMTFDRRVERRFVEGADAGHPPRITAQSS